MVDCVSISASDFALRATTGLRQPDILKRPFAQTIPIRVTKAGFVVKPIFFPGLQFQISLSPLMDERLPSRPVPLIPSYGLLRIQMNLSQFFKIKRLKVAFQMLINRKGWIVYRFQLQPNLTIS
jgi:hypothetical protein